MNLWLLDTGPIVAFLDVRDAEHDRVAEALQAHTGRLVTTSAVVVESMHLLGYVPSGAALLVDFLMASQTDVHECTSIDALANAAELMERYADTPMDFADATLVLLADRLKIYAVLTLDFRGFRTYRIRGRKAFELVLDSAP